MDDNEPRHRLPWCRSDRCDPVTRMIDWYGGDHPYQCPRCSSSPTPEQLRRKQEIARELEKRRQAMGEGNP